MRARAIENQCFVIAANQIGNHPGGLRSGGRSLIVDPWGLVLASAPDTESAIVADLDFDNLRDIRRRLPSRGPPPARGLRLGAARMTTAATDKRRVILDAAVRVFARQGFHTCRVSDIADEAGVAYGLVYHYFSSKEQILDTLFLERWDVMLAAIAEADASERAPEDKLRTIAGFIIDSYRHDPELMKVIIVEVTRAANTFGLTHLDKIRDAYAGIAAIVAQAQADGLFPRRDHARVRRAGLLRLRRAGADRAGSSTASAVGDEELERAKSMIVDTICRLDYGRCSGRESA